MDDLIRVYSHISGIDLVKAKDGHWVVLEDNLRIPSGASYPLIARELCRRCSPETFRRNDVTDNRGYGELLRRTMDSVNTGGINVVFTPGRYNAAYFEHSYLAEMTGAVLAEAGDLYVRDSALYYRATGGDQRVGAIYRRVSDEYMDPLAFEPQSLIGIPNLMAAYRAGSVGVLNAFGNGVADDKGIDPTRGRWPTSSTPAADRCSNACARTAPAACSSRGAPCSSTATRSPSACSPTAPSPTSEP